MWDQQASRGADWLQTSSVLSSLDMTLKAGQPQGERERGSGLLHMKAHTLEQPCRLEAKMHATPQLPPNPDDLGSPNPLCFFITRPKDL